MVSKSTLLRLGTVLSLGLALSACKAKVATSVNLSQLQDPQTSQVYGNLFLEVTTCHSYEDSRQPSDSLVKAQEMIPRVFPEAEYKECYSQGMDSFARFGVPIAVDHLDDDKLVSQNTINLVSADGSALKVVVPKPLWQRFKQTSDANMLGKLDMDVMLRVVNDTDKDVSYYAWSSWVNAEPNTLGQFSLGKGESVELKLSDVSVDQAVTYGSTTVLSKPTN